MEAKKNMAKSLSKDFRYVLIVGALLVGLSFAIGYVTDRSSAVTEEQPSFLEAASPRPQPAAGRVWKEYSFEKELVIDSSQAAQPVMMRLDDYGDVFLLDWKDLRIKMFSPQGNLVKTFGEERGAEGAFTNPTAFAVNGEGEVWVCDTRQRKIFQFDKNGKEIQTLMPRSAADRIAIVGSYLVTTAPPGGNVLFETYDSSGRSLNSFGEIIENQPQHGIILDGHVVSDAEAFIYGGRNLGVLARYSITGKQEFIVQTIDGVSLPTVQIIEHGIKVKPNSPLAALSLSLSGNQVYVLSGQTSGERQAMDVYNKLDGAYMFSFKLPLFCSEALLHSDRLYTLGEDGVTLWRFKPQS